MTEVEFISIAEKEMISISDIILASTTNSGKLNSPINSQERIEYANDFETQFSTRTHAMLFNLLREFESKNSSTISFPTGEKVEKIYDAVLLNYGRNIACGSKLNISG